MSTRSFKARAFLGATGLLVAACVLATPTAEASTPQISIKASGTSVTLGRPIGLTGTVTSDRGGKVVIQRKISGGTWNTTATVAPKSDGTFRLTAYVPRAGRYAFRAVRPKRNKVAQAISMPAPVAVYRYHYLADLTPIASAPDEGTGSSEISGVTYSHTVAYTDSCYYGISCGESTDFATFNLARQCLSLDGVAGLDDTSSNGAQDELELTLDSGQPSFDQSLGIGQSSHFNLDIRGQLRVTLTETANTSVAQNVASFGNARVYCTF